MFCAFVVFISSNIKINQPSVTGLEYSQPMTGCMFIKKKKALLWCLIILLSEWKGFSNFLIPATHAVNHFSTLTQSWLRINEHTNTVKITIHSCFSNVSILKRNESSEIQKIRHTCEKHLLKVNYLLKFWFISCFEFHVQQLVFELTQQSEKKKIDNKAWLFNEKFWRNLYNVTNYLRQYEKKIHLW